MNHTTGILINNLMVFALVAATLFSGVLLFVLCAGRPDLIDTAIYKLTDGKMGYVDYNDPWESGKEVRHEPIPKQ